MGETHTPEIRECLERLELDSSLIEQFLDLLTVVRNKACNGHKMAGIRLQELLGDAVVIGAAEVIESPERPTADSLNQALTQQINKIKGALKKS